MTASWQIIHGDCLAEMANLPGGSVDAIVTDPPYGLGFMGKVWDALPPGEIVAKEMLRVAKPGAHLVAFGGTRTYHRLACALEDAGWEIRDSLMWIYGSGFPKSLNLDGEWQGWGTALKPSHEPIVLARKPLAGTVAANVLAHGTGALNVDGCRVAGERGSGWEKSGSKASENRSMSGANYEREPKPDNPAGRWPPNVLLDDAAAAELDRQSGGETSRFFPRFRYEAKASSGERNAGLGDPSKVGGGHVAQRDGKRMGRSADEGANTRDLPRVANHHPTVKPIDLMRWLCRLVTPPGGTILDPFAGSGTTLIAATREGFNCIGIEREAEYVEIARRRIEEDAPLFNRSTA